MTTILNIETRAILLVLVTVLTGLSAGLCFTWTNAVTTGIARLTDTAYLQAFQQMNRTIINPTFALVFLGPALLIPLTAYLYATSGSKVLLLLAVAAALYVIGVAMVTMFGNVPLNEMLDKLDLATISAEDAKAFRTLFEAKWNNFHLVRTITSAISLTLLVITCLVRESSTTL